MPTPSDRFTLAQSELSPHLTVSFTLQGALRSYPCVLVVDELGELYAYRNLCPHWAVELSEADDRFLTPDLRRLRCGKHGAEFEISTGTCVAGPCEGDSLKPLRVWVERGVVVVTLPPMIVV